jgi:hypothetical protein
MLKIELRVISIVNFYAVVQPSGGFYQDLFFSGNRKMRIFATTSFLSGHNHEDSGTLTPRTRESGQRGQTDHVKAEPGLECGVTAATS